MRSRIVFMACLFLTASLWGCSGHGRYHDAPLGDPATYQAHFHDMDGNGDGRVDAGEFRSHFPQSDRHVFRALDLNEDGIVDHDEWHQFKAAHGIKHKRSLPCGSAQTAKMAAGSH